MFGEEEGVRERGFWVFFVRWLSLYTEFLVHEAPKLLFDPVCFSPRFGVLNTLCLVNDRPASNKPFASSRY